MTPNHPLLTAWYKIMFEINEMLLEKLLLKASKSLGKGRYPNLSEQDNDFLNQAQETALPLIDRLATTDRSDDYYSACLVFLAQALGNIRYNYERGERWAKRLYQEVDTALRNNLSRISRDMLLGILQAFYEARLEVPDSLKTEAADELIEDNVDSVDDEALREQGQRMINAFFAENPGLTAFELAGIFFQSLHSMPEYAIDPILVSLAENEQPVAQDAAILFLLHPNAAMRKRSTLVLAHLFADKSLSPTSLRRLITIRQWMPAAERLEVDTLIAAQRKRAVRFSDSPLPPDTVRYEASIFDGSGVQLIHFEIKRGKSTRIAGLLVKEKIGIRDAWITPESLPEKELRAGRKMLAQDSELIILPVSEAYVRQIASHYITLNNENGETPEPALLEIYEALGIDGWRAETADLDEILADLLHEMAPKGLSPTWIQESLARSGRLYEANELPSWFELSSRIDEVINRHTSLFKGRPHVNFDDALDELCATGFEYVRQKWTALFTWMALMVRSQPTSKNRLLWQDFATLAFVLAQGQPMGAIPLMESMIYESLHASIDSMKVRSGHLQGVS